MDLDLLFEAEDATEALLRQVAGREATFGGCWFSRGGLMGLFLSGGKAVGVALPQLPSFKLR